MSVSILPMYLHALPLECEQEVEITWTMRPQAVSRLLRAQVETIVPVTHDQWRAFELLRDGMRKGKSENSAWMSEMLYMLPPWDEDWRWMIHEIRVGNKGQLREPEPWPQVFPYVSYETGKRQPARRFDVAHPAVDITIKFGRTGPACLVRGVAFLETMQRKD